MITVENVSKQLHTFQLKHISFQLPAGYIMGLIGENGAGKTTLIRILSGLYSADKGTIHMDNQTNESNLKENLGVVLQDEMFERNTSLLHNARHYGGFYSNYDETILLNYMNRFSLEPKKKYRQLSKGKKLKFALAFALSHNPRLLLLDEPSANFDIDFRKEFHQILKEYIQSGENSVILSTHITSDIEQYADYILFLQNGETLLFDDIESIRDRYQMVSGEAYKIKLLKERVIYIEETPFGCKALVKNSKKIFDTKLKTWKPSIEEFMYFLTKGGIPR